MQQVMYCRIWSIGAITGRDPLAYVRNTTTKTDGSIAESPTDKASPIERGCRSIVICDKHGREASAWDRKWSPV